MNNAKILYVHVTGVSSEVMKNLVLAGVRAVLWDARAYPDAVKSTPTLLLSAQERASKKQKVETTTVAEAAKAAVEDMNPLLGECPLLSVSKPKLLDVTSDDVKDISIILASRVTPQEVEHLLKITEANLTPIFVADAFGLNASCIIDWRQAISYRPEMGKKLLDPVPLKDYIPFDDIMKTPLHQAVNRFFKQAPPETWMMHRCLLEYVRIKGEWQEKWDVKEFVQTIQREYIASTSPTLQDHETLSESALQRLAQISTSEVAPICAVLGGLIGNEVVKALSGKGEPANNTLLATSTKAWTYLVKAKTSSGSQSS